MNYFAHDYKSTRIQKCLKNQDANHASWDAITEESFLMKSHHPFERQDTNFATHGNIPVVNAVTTVGRHSSDDQYTSRKLRDRLRNASGEAPRDSCTGCPGTITLLSHRSEIFFR